ncbi:hypothetical protein PPTG_24758 [Phytophthora nicotianae INRA-310]|uniref:Uncharacterized protein n=1 Tax=Phytophthora nicotianae (strain INRA-310) TaxID=761204 RepID=W2PB05_PHYN3|nr:hypothetical protein PPTG_24758 [Phytophthora nicotianae INRA-310]ETM98011.1 hypothetical protein PPTG_24758 [Phytophthora nicotianae INRA-310]
MKGYYCQLEPLKPGRHAQEIGTVLSKDPDGARWTYMPMEEFTTINV